MDLRTAIREIKMRKPTTPGQFHSLGLPLSKEGSGIFREVYRIMGLPLVVKFPGNDRRCSKMHSTTEVRKIQQLSKIPWMRRHVPKVYYHDRKSGVLVQSWHAPFEDGDDAFQALGNLTTKFFFRSAGVHAIDIHSDNVRQGRTRQEIVFVDLGY